MLKNFKKELDLIHSNENISEKLMIFSLYNEFYNNILESVDNYLIEQCATLMEKTFESVVTGLNSQKTVSVNAEQFMMIYFKMLKKSKLSSISPAKSIITMFENKLSIFIDVSEYVNIIEQITSVPLHIKVDIMAKFREYINNMFLTIVRLYGEENSKKLRRGILDMLLIKLKEYLAVNLSEELDLNNFTNNLNTMMMIYVKEYLMNKWKSGEFNFENIQDKMMKDLFSSFNKTEQEIWLMEIIYDITGYDKSKKDEMIEEMCKLLDISKLKYMAIALFMKIRFLKAKKEIDNQTLNGNYSIQR